VTSVGLFFFSTIGGARSNIKKQNKGESEKQKMSSKTTTTTGAPAASIVGPLFAQLRTAVVEHSAGQYLRLKDGESHVVTVLVNYDPEHPRNNTPREEEVLNFDKTKKIWKLRLDCFVGNNNTTDTKIFHVRAQDKADVIALLERGVRRMRISRYGSTAQTTKYVFSEV
jgi:hypothetical protein